jgi:hypothetical protein
MQRILADFIRFDPPHPPNPRSIFRTGHMPAGTENNENRTLI